jgi:hypothetical protein
VHFADFVVSYSLHTNNRCLRYLAETDAGGVLAPGDDERLAEFADELSRDAHTVYSENLLAREARKLSSLWALVAPVIPADDEVLLRHIDRLRQAAVELSESSSSRRLAVRLASVAVDEGDAHAMLFVARRLPAHAQVDWDELNQLFTADSRYWRDRPVIRTFDDDIIVRRISKSYRKVYRAAQKIVERGSLDWSSHDAERLTRWSHMAAHQLELLRDSLSDKGKTRLWFLEKLSDSLRNLTGLRELLAQTQALSEANSLQDIPENGMIGTAIQYIEQQRNKMDGRIVRLAEKGFKTKPKRMQLIVEQAIAGSGLRQVSLVAASDGSGGKNDIGSPGAARS